MNRLSTIKTEVLAVVLTIAAAVAGHANVWAQGIKVTSNTSSTTTTFTITRSGESAKGRLLPKGLKKGVYIANGRKVIVKQGGHNNEETVSEAFNKGNRIAAPVAPAHHQRPLRSQVARQRRRFHAVQPS